MNDRKVLGETSPLDQRVAVSVRDWEAMKRAIWRSKMALAIAEREAREILGRCAHDEQCPGRSDDLAPCLQLCSDREQRMSALVIANAAQQLAPVDARKPAEGSYFAPSREYYSDVLAELGAAQALIAALSERGVQFPTLPDAPPTVVAPLLRTP